MNLKIKMMLATLIATAATLAAVGAPPNNKPVMLRVEHADTLLNLFGQDWEKAFLQNQITIIRGGKPVLSPDILVEGQVLRVSADTHLTPRAINKANGLADRRAALKQQLTELGGKGGPDAELIGKLRHTLADDVQYAADIDYLEREAGRLLHQTHPAQLAPSRPWAWVTGALALLCIGLAGLALRQRQREGPDADARMSAVLRDMERVLEPVPSGGR